MFLGSNVVVGNNVTIRSDVKIWPQKTVDSNSVVTKNLIWEERWKDTLFTDSRITGLSNIEITPDFSAKLEMGLRDYAGLESKILISRDIDNVSLMIKGSAYIRAAFKRCNSAGLPDNTHPNSPAGAW